MPEEQLYESVVVDTRPVVELGGEQFDMIPELINSVEVNEQEGGLSHVELLLDNTADHQGAGLDFAFEYTETDLFALGESVRILTGDAADPQEIFRGVISAVSFEVAEGGQPQLRVMAEDALMSWRMTKRNRFHEAGPLRDILEALAQNTTLTPVITGLNDAVDAQQQLNETDLAFLRRLLVRYDADAQVVGEELHISPRQAVDRGSVTLAVGAQLHSVRVTADLAQQRPVTELNGFDLASGTVEAVSSNEDGLGPGDGATGSEFAQEVFPGARHRLERTTFETAREAQALVDAAQRRRARQFVIAEGRATGNSAIRVGTRLTLEGLGPRFSNEFYTVRARHMFDRRRGYRTDFTAESSFFRRLS